MILVAQYSPVVVLAQRLFAPIEVPPAAEAAVQVEHPAGMAAAVVVVVVGAAEVDTDADPTELHPLVVVRVDHEGHQVV